MLPLSANLSINLPLIVSILAGVCVSSRAVGWFCLSPEAEAVAPGVGCDLGRAIGDLSVPLAGDADAPLLAVHGGVCATMVFLRWLLSKGIW